MTQISNNADFENALSDHGILEDCLVQTIGDVSGSKTAVIELLQVVESDWQAGSMATYKKLALHFTAVKKWHFTNPAETFLDPDHYVDAFDFNDSPHLSFTIDVPAIFEVEAGSVRIEEGEVFEKEIEPWLSADVVFVDVANQKAPTPQDWLDFFTIQKINAVWRVLGSAEARATSTVPYPDYSGFYLQFADSLKNADQGLFFFHLTQDDTGFKAHIQNENEDNRLFTAFAEILAARYPDAQISCGNCKLSIGQWLEHIRSGDIFAE